MRKSLAATFTFFFILALLPAFVPTASTAVLREHCACSAHDGSCSASVTCTGGCTQHCDVEGDCYAYCSGYFGFLGMEVTFEAPNATYPTLVDELSRVSGKDIVFSPTKPNAVFNAGFKRASLWDALEDLSDQGTLQVAGQDFERIKKLRRSLLAGVRSSLCVKNTPVQTFVTDMASLTGLPLRIAGGNPMAMVNVKLQDVTLDDILASVSEQTGTKIVEAGVEPTAR